MAGNEGQPGTDDLDAQGRVESGRGPNEEFVRLFTQAQRSLYLFLLPLVHSSADAEEVLQETNVVILSKWNHFEPGTNFIAWCRAIARLEVFRFRRARHHKMKLLDEDVIELLMEQSEEASVDLELRRDALSECIGKLKAPDQELIQRRYRAGVSGDDVAHQLGRPANSVYQSLGRIRRVLMECIRRRMTSGGVQ